MQKPDGSDPEASAPDSEGSTVSEELRRFGRFALVLEASWDRLDYVVGDSISQIIRAEPRFETALASWFWLGLGYRYTSRTSDGSLSDLATWEYTKNEAWLTARLEY